MMMTAAELKRSKDAEKRDQINRAFERAVDRGYTKPRDVAIATIAELEAMGYQIVRKATVKQFTGEYDGFGNPIPVK